MAKIDPKIFETGSGILYVWFNNEGVPERGIVEDMIGLGDVMGTWIRRAYEPNGKNFCRWAS